MPLRFANLDPQPAGFGLCARCAYRETGTAEICFICASRVLEPLDEDGCEVCGLTLKDDGSCPNYVCTWPTRHFERNHAIAIRSGDIEQAINAYKYKEIKGWSRIFGRVLVGFLDKNADVFGSFDLIIATPTYTSTGGNSRTWDHTRLVVVQANAIAEGRWPFYVSEPYPIIKLRATTALVGNGWKKRREIAEGELRDSLSITDSGIVEGKNILVFDDVFTDGFTLREIARCLIMAGGTTSVSGVTLVRQPLRARN